tara:strand:+ start:99 stop:653 length:555 start_codon:yes stop_codon:yes gene_type:complete
MSGAGAMRLGRVHSRAAYLRIKAASRELYTLAGGLERAAAGTRVAKTKLQGAGSSSPEHETVFLAADVIADLEAAAGEPVVTRELAHLAGYELYCLPRPDADEKWVGLLGEISGEAGEIIAKLAEALRDDGIVTAREVRQLDLIGQTDDALRALVRLREALVVTADAEALGVQPRFGKHTNGSD